jgi:tetratricopeptide (TPR) repeat protein
VFLPLNRTHFILRLVRHLTIGGPEFLGDGAGFAWAVLGYCSDRIAIAPPVEQAEMLVEALDGLDPGEHLLRGRLLARLATEMYWTSSPDRTLELAEQALVEATIADDTEGRLWAWYAMAFGHWTPTRADQLLTACETYLNEAEAAGDRTHQLLAHRWLVPIVTELGDIDRGAREAVAAIELADELGLAVQQWMARVIAASQQLVVGDLDRAEALAAEALMIGTGCEPETAFDYASIFTWTVHWLRGTLDEIVTLVEAVALVPGVDGTRRLALAQTYGELGRIDEATAILDQLSDDDLAELPHDTTWFISMASLAEAAAACQHVRAASFAFESLGPFQDRIAITSLTAVGPMAHYVGIAAWAAGHRKEAIGILTEAVTFGERVGTPVFAERSRRALAARLSSLRSS